MSKPFPGSTPALLCLGLLLAGCGGVNLWPFGDGETSEPSRAPANATAYQCEGGKRLYVRLLEDGAAAWAILPEREIRLDKAPSGSGTTYTVPVTPSAQGAVTCQVQAGAGEHVSDADFAQRGQSALRRCTR